MGISTPMGQIKIILYAYISSSFVLLCFREGNVTTHTYLVLHSAHTRARRIFFSFIFIIFSFIIVRKNGEICTLINSTVRYSHLRACAMCVCVCVINIWITLWNVDVLFLFLFSFLACTLDGVRQGVYLKFYDDRAFLFLQFGFIRSNSSL